MEILKKQANDLLLCMDGYNIPFAMYADKNVTIIQ